MENKEWIVSTPDLCFLFGVTRAAISKWHKAGCPCLSRGKWDLGDVIKWRVKTDSPTQQVAGDVMRQRKLKADTEYREERALRERLLRESLEAQYFKRTDVEEAWAVRATEAKTAFLIFEKTLPMELVGKSADEMEIIIAARVREVLSNYARQGDLTPKDEPDTQEAAEGDQGVDASGENNGKRVGGQAPHS